PERQLRILRWVAESLGVPLVGAAANSAQIGGVQNISPVPPMGGATIGGLSTDIKSFIAAKAPKSDQQFASAVAYFYRFEAPPAERRDSINGDVLQEAARLAGRKRLSNPR